MSAKELQSKNCILELPDTVTTHSVRNDFTGFAIAAFIDWKLIVNNAISNAATPATIKTHHPILTR